MAHKTSKGSTDLGRDSRSKRLGVKIFGNQHVSKGEIIIRQRGTSYQAGANVKQGSDDTLYALVSGLVKFTHKQKRGFHGNLKDARIVSVEPK